MLNRFFNRSPTGYAQALDAVSACVHEIEALRKRLATLERSLRDLEESHSTTVSHLHKLRGQVHGGRHGKGAHVVEEIPFGDKDALRARAGILAGRPVQHANEE